MLIIDNTIFFYVLSASIGFIIYHKYILHNIHYRHIILYIIHIYTYYICINNNKRDVLNV